MPTVVNQPQRGKDIQTQITLDAQTDRTPGKNWINMSLSYWIHPSISIFNLVLGLKAKKNKQNVLLGRQFQLFLSSKNAIGDMELSTQCYFSLGPCILLERGFCHPCLCETYNVTVQTRSLSGPPPASTATLLPSHPHMNHHGIKLAFHLLEDMAVFCRQCQPPRASDLADSFCVQDQV